MKSRRASSRIALGFALALAGAASLAGASCAEDLDKPIPAAAVDTPKATAEASDKIVLAGGCFWGQQGVFEHLKGVTKVIAGYSGGAKNTATYDQVTTETTNHAEAVEITFNPKIVSVGDILKVFFSVAHDPTELNRQGPDSGTSYRTEIFFNSPDQQKIATAYVKQLTDAKVFRRPIVTKIEQNKGFYAAEGYHQDYLIHNPNAGYIVINDMPKIAAFKKVWPDMFNDKPVTVPFGLLN